MANLFFDASASMVKPGGAMILATPNRPAGTFTHAIVGVECVLGWLPRGTRDWQVRTPDCTAIATNKHAIPKLAMGEARPQ